MCEKAFNKNPSSLRYVPNDPRFCEMCERAVKNEPYNPNIGPDHFKTQEMCKKAIEKDSVPQNLSQIILRPERRVKNQLKNIHGFEVYS